MEMAAPYGIKARALYDYTTFDQIAGNADVKAICIVLPNSMHAEFTLRGVKAGKHILCEKPMATNAEDCERMIAACAAAQVKRIIAYRSQFEVYDRLLVTMIRGGKPGSRKWFRSDNKNVMDEVRWRKARPLEDIYALCLRETLRVDCLDVAACLPHDGLRGARQCRGAEI